MSACATADRGADRRIADAAAAQAGLETARAAAGIAARTPAIETLPGDCSKRTTTRVTADMKRSEAILRQDAALTQSEARRARCVALANERIAAANARNARGVPQ